MPGFGATEFRKSIRKHNPNSYDKRPVQDLLRGVLKCPRAARQVEEWLDGDLANLLERNPFELYLLPDMGEGHMHALCSLKEIMHRVFNEHPSIELGGEPVLATA